MAKRRAAVLHHPWRIRVLEILGERDMSCAQIVDEGLISELSEPPRHQAISNLAYHFRFLQATGAITVVDKIRIRGSTENVCRAVVPAYHTDKDWAKLPIARRRPITDTTLNGLMARARAAIAYDTFDQRDNRHLSNVPMEVDEEGWDELVRLMSDTLGAVIQIKHDAKQRLKASGEQPVRVTYGQLGFQSAPLPPAVGDPSEASSN